MRIFTYLIGCLAFFIAVSLNGMAAEKGQIFTTGDGRQFATSSDGSRTIARQPAQAPPTASAFPGGASPIYNNFARAYPLGLYWTWQSLTISGTNSPLGYSSSFAAPFTPAADATVTEIALGAGLVTGTNEVVVSLNADSGGLPGQSMGTATIAKMKNAPICCKISTGNFSIQVSAGTQYWVVVQAASPDSNTWAGWYLSTSNERASPFAQFYKGKWSAVNGVLPVFAVLGTKQ